MKNINHPNLWDLLVSISKCDLTPNQVYVLLNMSVNIDIPEVNTHQEVRALRTKDFLDVEGKISDKVLPILNELESIFINSKKKVNSKDQSIYIAQYLEIIPNIVIPTSGKRARVAASNLVAPFAWFFKNHDFDWDTVLKATQIYISEYELKNWNYMATCLYFVRKQALDKSWVSELANYCTIVKSGDIEEDTSKFPEKVV